MKRLIPLAAAALLAGCGVTVTPATSTAPATITVTNALPDMVNKLAAIGVPDLQAAQKDAVAHNDSVAAVCYAGLVPVVQQVQAIVAKAAPASVTVPKPVGVVTAFQLARDAKAAVNALPANLLNPQQFAAIRQQINLSCAPLAVDTQAGIADPLGLMSGPALPVVSP